jgi:hypothetical protein
VASVPMTATVAVALLSLLVGYALAWDRRKRVMV